VINSPKGHGLFLAFYDQRRLQEKFSTEEETMKIIGIRTRQGGSNSQRGGTNGYYILVGMVIAVVALIAVGYFQDRSRDYHVHLPRIEVH
jgi:hypothetical protein